MMVRREASANCEITLDFYKIYGILKKNHWSLLEVVMQVLKDEIRNGIMQSALEEFYLYGYDKTSMNAIAKRCGISKSNLYNYFPSKEYLYDAIMEPAMTKLRKVAYSLTDKEILRYSKEERPQLMTSMLQPLLVEYRKQIVVLLQTGRKEKDTAFIAEITEVLVQCFFTFDEHKMPKKFAYVLTHMLMEGIVKIISETSDEKEISQQISALFRYHVYGASGLA